MASNLVLPRDLLLTSELLLPDDLLLQSARSNDLNTVSDLLHKFPLTVHAACGRSGDVTILRNMLEAAVIYIDVQDYSGATPLIRAIRARRCDLVDTLLSAGADVGISDNCGFNPFHVSVDDSKMTQLLCNHATQTRHSLSPLYAREHSGHTPLSYAVRSGRRRAVQMYLDAGYDINHKNPNFASLLHLSVESKDVALTEMFLEYGADCNATDDKRCTPLHYAVKYMYYYLPEFHETLLVFLERGVDLDLRGITDADNNMIYESALNYALSLSEPKLAGLLVRYGCNPDSVKSRDPHIRAGYASDFPGKDAMTQSLKLGRIDLCKLLHAAGANPKKLLTKIGQRAASPPDPEMEALEASIRRPFR